MGQTLTILDEPFVVCRLAPNAEVPGWALAPGAFTCIARTRDELSIVCDERHLPADVDSTVTASGPWRCFRVEGPLDFGLTGVMASLASPLADADISIFPISTFDTDYVFVKAETLDAAADALSRAGHTISPV